MPGDTEIILRLVLASLLGALIGLEREVHGREAGVRTYLLVALGSALFMIVSQYLAASPPGTRLDSLFRGDPGRIAAQAVTGIGFLGAGVILRYRNSVRGLTTAAGMWVVCAVGLAAGSGHYVFAVVASAITMVSLVGLKEFEKRIARDWYREIAVASDDVEGQFERIRGVIKGHRVQITAFSLKKDLERKEMTVTFSLLMRGVEPVDRMILKEVSLLGGVRCVELR